MSHEGLPSEPIRLWQRVRDGLATAVFGRLPEPPPELHLLRVSCDVAPAELRPLLEARRRAEAILDEEQPLLDQARERVVSGLRRRLLGDASDRATEAVLVEVWNHLAKQTGRSWALVLEAVEAADATTLATLAQIVRRPGWLQLPLVLVFRGEPEGAAARLLATLREHAGAEAVLRGEAQGAPAAAVDRRALPFEVLRVLRAGALVGPGFEADVVAALLAEPPGAVLERLQQAADLGVPVEDRGEGRFSLPAAEIAALAASILPSLAQAWHRRLGGLLGERAGDEEARRAEEPAPAAMAHGTGVKGQANPVGLCGADVDEAEGEAMAGSEVFAQREAASERSGAGDSGVFARGPAADREAAVDEAPGAGDSGVFARAPDREAPEEAEVLARRPVMVVQDRVPAAGKGREAEHTPRVGREEPVSPSRTRDPDAAEVFARRRTEAHVTAGEHRAEAPSGGLAGGGVAGEVVGEEPHEASAAVEPAAVEEAARAAADELRAEQAAARQAAARLAAASTLPRPGSLRQGPRASSMRADPGEPGEPRAGTGRGDPMVDAVRAAEHLRMAGELDAAAERYCAAARAADEAGAPQAAAQHVRRALAVLAELPASPGRRRLRARALIELGRLQWQSAGPELGSTLTEALATLEGVRQELGPGDPVTLYAELCQAIAGVCFDLGDLRSLERALEELSSASRALHAAGDATGAARLLNDQAAVYVRMGDPVRALHLLRESRQVFEASSAADPVVLRELAETDRLFARIPLHAQLRAGREQDGYTMGLDHALAAERAYRQLGDTRELARVWETMGRLELRKGRAERAGQRLQAALEVQMQLGDLTGLARTTEALSEVLAASGRDAEALTLLRDSVLFNREKGSPLGLALCRRAFDGLARRVAAREELGPALHQLAGLLDAAEGELGAMRLPGEGD